LKRGDTVSISEPFGDFICDNSPAYWIASGTGIAPFYSMLKAGLGTDKILLHGGRTAESFYFQNEIFSALGKDYVRCCSQETGDGLYNGRLTEFLKNQTDLPLNYKYYLCGSAEMVVDVRDILISKGIPYGHIFAEIYF
jgi:ferredoxin--NADP+ reductase